MKKLSTYLFLIFFSFSAPTFANDIQDFQIEGISVGDSLLDYFSEEKIKENSQKNYFEGKFISVVIDHSQFFQVYDEVQFIHKKNDRIYRIYSITGYIDYDTNIDGCYKKLDELDKELSTLFIGAKRYIEHRKILSADKSGKSTMKQISYDLKSGDGASISCTDWSSKMNYPDGLQVNLDSKEIRYPPRCFVEWCY